MSLKDRFIAIIWLFFLVIWRILAEAFRFVIFLIFFIPMLLSDKVYDIMKDFLYESFDEKTEEHGDTKTIGSEGESLQGDSELYDNVPD